MTIRLVSWNIDKCQAAWQQLADDESIDVALVQEAVRPRVSREFDVFPATPDWTTAGGTRTFTTAIARLSERVTVEPLRTVAIADAKEGNLGVSQPGTLCVAQVAAGGAPLTVVSVYCAWDEYVTKRDIFADNTAHRILSDISPLLTAKHRLVLAGDWNILFGYGEDSSEIWKRRYQTVFDRAEALGLVFVGPQSPNGIQAEPWPKELPRESKNVPTFRQRGSDSAIGTRQLDFVLASAALQSCTKVTALNRAEEWGPSDHCRVLIEIDLDALKD